MRTLKSGQQCEHSAASYVDGKLTTITCDVRHHHREPGQPPKQLVPVKDGRDIRFFCLVHAPMHTKITKASPMKQKRGSIPWRGFGAQESLL